MKLMEGQSFEVTGSGHWKKIEVEVELGDLIVLLSEWGVEEYSTVSTQLRFYILSLLAQQLLAFRVHEAGGYTDSEYSVVTGAIKTKIAAVKAKLTKDNLHE